MSNVVGVLSVLLRVVLFAVAAVMMAMPSIKRLVTFVFCGFFGLANLISLVGYLSAFGKDILPKEVLIFHNILPALLFLTILGLLLLAELGILNGRLASVGVIATVLLNVVLIFVGGGRLHPVNLLTSGTTLSLLFLYPLLKSE